MTHEGIEELIDALNTGQRLDRIFRCSLSSCVDFARVWCNEPRGGTIGEGSSPFYFIKDEHGLYVAAVFDMDHDLHAFVKTGHRKKGHLCRALTEVILPRLYQLGRETQTVTFEDSAMADYVVRRLGFRLGGEHSADKDLTIYSTVPKIEPKRSNLTANDLKASRANTDQVKLYLKMIKERLEVAYGECDLRGIDDLIYERTNELHDQICDFIEWKRHNESNH